MEIGVVLPSSITAVVWTDRSIDQLLAATESPAVIENAPWTFPTLVRFAFSATAFPGVTSVVDSGISNEARYSSPAITCADVCKV